MEDTIPLPALVQGPNPVNTTIPGGNQPVVPGGGGAGAVNITERPFTLDITGLSPDQAINKILSELSQQAAHAGNNAAKLSATDTVRAQQLIQQQQAIQKLMEQVLGLSMDQKILPFKLAGAFARGLNLTTLS